MDKDMNEKHDISKRLGIGRNKLEVRANSLKSVTCFDHCAFIL